MTELDWEEFRRIAASVDASRLADGGKSGTVPGKTIPCPLRQLAKWLESEGGTWRAVHIERMNGDVIFLECEGEGDNVESNNISTLEAAADAVKQLKEKGEL